jgi:HEAT repeat protein
MRTVLLAIPLLLLGASAALRAGESADLAAVRALLKDPSPSARAAAVRRLSGRADAAALAVLVERLEDPHPYVRRASAGVLGILEDARVRARLAQDLAGAKGETTRLEACRALALWADRHGLEALLRLLRADRAAVVRAEAARWLVLEPAPEVSEALAAALGDPDGLVRAEALDALRGRAERASAGRALLADPDPRVRVSALESSVAETGEPAVVAVLHGLDDAVWSVRFTAAELAGRVRDRRLLAPLVARLEDGRRRVAEAAHASLVALSGIPFDLAPGPWRAWLEGDGRDFDPALRPEDPPRPFAPDPGGRTVTAARFLDLPVLSRHVGFVLDASGSMSELMPDGARRWDHVRAELDRALAGLGDGEGNVYVFADEVEAAFPKAEPLSAGRRAHVARWLARRGPRGHTALYDGIAAALRDPAIDTVVVLSDGAPSTGSFFTKTDLLAELRRLNRWRKARIDVVAVGSDNIAARWRDLLQRLADETGGTLVER